MQRILVIGSPGAGKSTLARRLADTLGLPLIHLDREYFGPGWTLPDRDAWRVRVTELIARPSWVMDGNYASTFDIRVPRATTIIWLDAPRWLCLLRVTRRVLQNLRTETTRSSGGLSGAFRSLLHALDMELSATHGCAHKKDAVAAAARPASLYRAHARRSGGARIPSFADSPRPPDHADIPIHPSGQT